MRENHKRHQEAAEAADVGTVALENNLMTLKASASQDVFLLELVLASYMSPE